MEGVSEMAANFPLTMSASARRHEAVAKGREQCALVDSGSPCLHCALNLITFTHKSILFVYVQLCKEEGKSAPVPALRKHEFQKNSVVTDCYPEGRKHSRPQERKQRQLKSQ